MTCKIEVFCKTNFIAFHVWLDAPAQFGYLGIPHRHEFFVHVYVRVTKMNREVEFHELKNRTNYIICREYGACLQTHTNPIPNAISESCEVIAGKIAGALRNDFQYDVSKVVVLEDDECGGQVTYE